jgi:hypothetical protein
MGCLVLKIQGWAIGKGDMLPIVLVIIDQLQNYGYGYGFSSDTVELSVELLLNLQ